jgi:MoaA/NifB/PqqE/SkfB family radical SAM enzyme
MNEETFRRIEPAFSSANLVFLQGWGEPMMHPRFWEFVRRARAGGPRVGFTTNGMLLDAVNRRALLESGVEIMGVSLAGATRRTHDRFREGSPLAVIDRHLSLLKEEKRTLGSESPRLHLAYLLLADNLTELPDLLELAEHWGAAQVVVSTLDLVLSPTLVREALGYRPDLWPELEDRLEAGHQMAERAGIRFDAYGFSSYPAEPACTENVLRSCFVSADGRVSPCVMANLGVDEGTGTHHRIEGEEIPIQRLDFGSIQEHSLEEIWRSRKAREFRKIFRERIWEGRRDRKGLPDVCAPCQKLGRAPWYPGRVPIPRAPPPLPAGSDPAGGTLR